MKKMLAFILCASLLATPQIKIGSNVKVSASSGTSLGYTMELRNIVAFNPADSTSHYIGQRATISTAWNSARHQIQKACTIKSVVYNFKVDGTTPSAEAADFYIRLNDTTDIGNWNTAMNLGGNTGETRVTGLSTALVAGDYIAIKLLGPAWATNPTSVYVGAEVYCE
jgi:hypothetical protein